MTQHTLGPWRACYSDEFGGGNIRSDHHRDGTGALLLEAGPMFHDYTPDSAEEQANLRLAAAAPDLLAIVDYLAEAHRDGAQEVYFGAIFGYDDITTLGDAVIAAIDKAVSQEVSR